MCVGVLPQMTPTMHCAHKPNMARCNLSPHSCTTTVFSGSQLTSHPFQMAHDQGHAPSSAVVAGYLVFTPFQIYNEMRHLCHAKLTLITNLKGCYNLSLAAAVSLIFA